MNELLKKYDKYLRIKKTLDWRKILQRVSPVYKKTSYDVLEITNKYLGSWRWLMSKIKKMDSRNNDFIISALIKNEKLRKRKDDNRISEEIASFIFNWEKIII